TGLHELGVRLGLPMSLAALGLPEAALAGIAVEVMTSTPANPRPYDDAAVRSILHAAWECDLPG
ncbi:MAG: maleylacetate reductase, partial [Actinomycetota bacterium]|nr:maleylacetate reductase [Actinomycetota bacterium]